MAASGSGGEAARPWTATSTWAPAGVAAVEDAISFETSDLDAEEAPAGVVVTRPSPNEDGDAPPCEVTASTAARKCVEDLLAGIGVSSTVTPVAGEELQKVCDLLYEYKDDMLRMTSTEKIMSKSSPSLEVLLAESSNSEVQISDDDAGIGSAQLFDSFSSDDGASATTEPLVDVADLSTESEVYAAALNEPLANVDGLPLETFAGGSSGEHPNSLI